MTDRCLINTAGNFTACGATTTCGEVHTWVGPGCWDDMTKWKAEHRAGHEGEEWRARYAALISDANEADFLLASVPSGTREEWEYARAYANRLRDEALVVKAKGDRRSRPKTGPGSVGYRPVVGP